MIDFDSIPQFLSADKGAIEFDLIPPSFGNNPRLFLADAGDDAQFVSPVSSPCQKKSVSFDCKVNQVQVTADKNEQSAYRRSPFSTLRRRLYASLPPKDGDKLDVCTEEPEVLSRRSRFFGELVPKNIKQWRIGRRIGEGSFGVIYTATHEQTKQEVAVKFERGFLRHPQLIGEAKIYRIMHGQAGVPCVVWYGVEGNWNVMVMELLGSSLEVLFRKCSNAFSLRTISLIGKQMLARVEMVHRLGFLHRDVKPDNFVLGLPRTRTANRVHVIDFGLAKSYLDPSGAHIPMRVGKRLTGTVRYASVNAHLGLEQSRRDDVESLGFVLVQFCKGSLPWQGLYAPSKEEKCIKIMEAKLKCRNENYSCGCPEPLQKFLLHCGGLEFKAAPDYSYLRKCLDELLTSSSTHVFGVQKVPKMGSLPTSRQQYSEAVASPTMKIHSTKKSIDDRISHRPRQRCHKSLGRKSVLDSPSPEMVSQRVSPPALACSNDGLTGCASIRDGRYLPAAMVQSVHGPGVLLSRVIQSVAATGR